MDIRLKLTAVGYLSKRLQLSGQELQGLGYSLSVMDRELRTPGGRVSTPDEFHNIAGTASRLHAQIEHTLQELKQLMFACESVAPKGEDS